MTQTVRQSPVLANRLQRYVQVLAMQGTQVAACNRLHEVDERLARWLLMCQDRIGSSFVPLTQEFLAHMLGTLTPREERIIKMRFGLDGGSEHTLEEVGQVFAVTRERIRQIEAKALRKLRHPSRSRRFRIFLEGSF